MEHAINFVVINSCNNTTLCPRGINSIGYNSLLAQRRELIRFRREFNTSLFNNTFSYVLSFAKIQSNFRGLSIIVTQVYSLLYVYTVNGSLLPDRTSSKLFYEKVLECNNEEDMDNLVDSLTESYFYNPSHYDRYSSHNAYLQKAIFGDLYPNVPRLLFNLPNIRHFDLYRIRCWLSLLLFSVLEEEGFIERYSATIAEDVIDCWQNPVLNNYIFIMSFDDMCMCRIVRYVAYLKQRKRGLMRPLGSTFSLPGD